MEKENECFTVKKIVVTGVECSGKTTLSRALAQRYDLFYISEFSREYLHNLQRDYEISDLNKIALEQYRSEFVNETYEGPGIICDTSLLVIKVWSQVKYGQAHPLINSLLQLSLPDLYILPDYNIPFEEDPLRESRQIRPELFEKYREEVQKTGVDHVIVSGSTEERIKQLDLTLISLLGNYS